MLTCIIHNPNLTSEHKFLLLINTITSSRWDKMWFLVLINAKFKKKLKERHRCWVPNAGHDGFQKTKQSSCEQESRNKVGLDM